MVKCNRGCGATDLRWKVVNSKYKLFNKQEGLKLHVSEANGDASKMFTINSTASGIAITGDDRHNAIYLPKIAVSELVKALVDFI